MVRKTTRQSGTLAGAVKEGERRPDSRVGPHSGSRQGGLRAAGVAAARIAAPIVARHGGGALARLKAQWRAVVGDELAALTWPESLGRDGALKLRVAPGRALELQHRAPLVVERINLFFGRGIVARLILVQGPLPLTAPSLPVPAPPLAASDSQALDTRLGDISDPQLRAALGGLGRLVLADRSGR